MVLELSREQEMTIKYHVGTSGWHYQHWRDKFYPLDLKTPGWLDFYSRSFTTVELNNSFYHLPTEKAFATWKDTTPPGFIFSVKVSRFITHMKRLKNTAEPLANFMSRAQLLEEKMGPLLYQLPPSMKRNEQMLEDFLKTLPQGQRHVFEFRDESWLADEVFQLLRHYHAGFCIFDMPQLTTPMIATTDFAYIRFHGSTLLYGGNYSEGELKGWAHRITGLGVEAVYAYFNNDAEGFAIRNALVLEHLLEETS